MKKEGTVSCEEWTFMDFVRCAEGKLREQIKKEGFKCHTIWWKKYFPDGVRACIDEDIKEITRFRLGLGAQRLLSNSQCLLFLQLLA